MSTAVQFNPFSPDFLADPYPYFQRLRSEAPLYFWAEKNVWVLTRYEDCLAMLKESRLGQQIKPPVFSEERERLTLSDDPNPYSRMKRHWMLFRDPPAHTRLKGLVHKAFTPHVVEALHGKIQRLTDDLLDAALERGSMEVISDLAFPVSITVIAEMLGVPPSDGNLFRRWSEEFAVRADMEISEETFRRTSQVTIEFANYLRDLVQERRRQPREDLLSMLVAVEEQGDRLTEEELVATAMILLVAGNQTSASLIGNGTYALLRFPDQMQKLKENPALVKTAIEEFLRFESPVQVAARFVMEDFEYRGQAFRRGQQVTAALAAANRDPEQFANPDTVDITRENNKHLAFGNGIHFCLGAPLARLEGQTVFTTLVRRLPKLQLAAESVAYRPIYSLRILQSLPVTV